MKKQWKKSEFQWKEFFLDTSFIHRAIFLNNGKTWIETNKAWQLLNFLIKNKIPCVIWNITSNELYNNAEKIAYDKFIESEIIAELEIDRKKWYSFTPEKRQKLREDTLPLIRTEFNEENIKDFRSKINRKEYLLYTLDAFNQIDSVLNQLNLREISNIFNGSIYREQLKNSKLDILTIDTSDLNQVLLCKSANIRNIITCDWDYSALEKTKDFDNILLINESFELLD